MPRGINLEELKAKFNSGLRPALRPASPGGQGPNTDLIAELKSANWTASLKKTDRKKKKQQEENKVCPKSLSTTVNYICLVIVLITIDPQVLLQRPTAIEQHCLVYKDRST